MGRAALAALLAASGPVIAACPPGEADGRVASADAHRVAWRVEGEPLAVARHFSLLLQVCPVDARLKKVDATMPEHRHGMNYRPSLTPLGGGRYRAEGLMFHMAGRWELLFDLEAGEAPVRPVRLRDSVMLP